MKLDDYKEHCQQKHNTAIPISFISVASVMNLMAANIVGHVHPQ